MKTTAFLGITLSALALAASCGSKDTSTTGTGSGASSSASASSAGGAGTGGKGSGGSGAYQPSCGAPAVAPSMGKCFTANPNECNPITNEGCSAQGDACDSIAGDGAKFSCLPGSKVALCGQCPDKDNFYCAGTLTCITQNPTGSCARFCCDDGDCGGGTCKLGLFKARPSVGVCVK